LDGLSRTTDPDRPENVILWNQSVIILLFFSMYYPKNSNSVSNVNFNLS